VRLIDALSDPAGRTELAELYAHPALAGLGVVVMCAVLSVLVVVKRLGFVGQGVSHSALGGIGVAALLAALGVMPEAGAGQMTVVVAFCVLAALGMARLSDRSDVPVDTAIGLFLVGSMALGAILVQVARDLRPSAGQSWEAILFGSILASGPTDVWVAWGVGLGVLAALWLVRRPLLFWALDEDAARAFGVPTGLMRIALMVLLSLAVVVAMRLAGVVLATALLVLPGATALRLSRRMGPVVWMSVGLGVAGLFGGLALSYELDLQPGPSVVGVMTVIFGAALLAGRVMGGRVMGPARGGTIPS
jgi:zinc transport system permease protein